MQLKTGQVGEIQTYNIGKHEIPYRDVIHPDGVIRLEYFHEKGMDSAEAYGRFRARMVYFQNEYANWATVGMDSMTLAELSARKQEELVLNPSAKDARQWFAGSTSAMEDMFIVRFGGLPMNVGLICHVDKDPVMIANECVRNANARGRLGSQGMINAAYQEQYFLYTQRDQEGNRQFAMKTENDGRHQATTQIGAPHPCYPSFNSIWTEWDKGDIPRMPIHCLIYGDTGTGKSTFLATFPKPMIVFLFDPKGKDIPFWHHWEG
jgi:hypothetical protein